MTTARSVELWWPVFDHYRVSQQSRKSELPNTGTTVIISAGSHGMAAAYFFAMILARDCHIRMEWYDRGDSIEMRPDDNARGLWAAGCYVSLVDDPEEPERFIYFDTQSKRVEESITP